MPLINGQKMACEPCIRGHRSTKCTHANDRLMVPVRKPGRPLSSCPHPSSKPCSCGAVTAAIPRKQKCSCGPSEHSNGTNGAKVESEESSNIITPPEETKASSSNHRVQKPTNRRASVRKPSVDPAGLERMDSSQLNILPTYDTSRPNGGVGSNGMSAMNGVQNYGPLGFAPPGDAFAHQPMMLPMFPQSMQAQTMNAGPSPASTNGHISSPTNGSASPKVLQQARGSCCGGGASQNSGNGAVAPEIPQTPVPDVKSDSEGKIKSCCSSKTASSGGQTPSSMVSHPQMPQQAYGMMMPPFHGPVPMANGMYPFFAHPTVFTYPPQYGTYMQPLQPDQWRQVIAALSSVQPQTLNGFGMPSHGGGTIPYTPTQDNHGEDNGTSHHCDCGEGCQCVGCAAHPYNEATQNYVRSAWNSMADEQTNSSHAHSNGASHENSAVHTPSDTAPVSPVNPESNGRNTAPHTPSDAASGLMEEQTLSANDFFFVSYPFGDTCGGDTASCPCGDDCQCIGCVIHSNPDPLQPSQPSEHL